MITIALDAMGGENAPEAEVRGAIAAAQGDISVVLVGHEDRLAPYLDSKEAKDANLRVVHASESISMEDPAITPLRKKRDASIRVANRLVHKGEADAVVTAGNTGAAMMCSKVILGTLPGVDRPALATPVPTIDGSAILLDVGANSLCKPYQLEQFALMGSIYCKILLGIDRPRVGLLSIGEEDSKGNTLTRDTHGLLVEAPIHFTGNVESRGLFAGDVDVAVTDGFTGNMVLKTGEAIFELVANRLRNGYKRGILRRIAGFLSRPVFRSLKGELDYAAYGGALLLGLKSVSIITHGRAQEKAIATAIRLAAHFQKEGLLRSVSQAIANDPTQPKEVVSREPEGTQITH